MIGTKRQSNIYDWDLDRDPANYQPLTPLGFLPRAASIYPDKTAVIHGNKRYSYSEFYRRCRRLTSALQNRGVGLGDTVALMAPNVPAMLEAHFGVPMAGAVLNALNYRLDGETLATILNHGEAKVLITDREMSVSVKDGLSKIGRDIVVIDIDDPLAEGGDLLGEMDYEAFLAEGDPEFPWSYPEDEWQALALNYTSGTTGNPKGVVYHHRGAFLNAVGNAMVFGLAGNAVYLWTLPMFHCNGWTHTWAVTAVAGTHVCLRKLDPALIFHMIAEHDVTHMCGAPIVLNMLIHASDEVKGSFHRTVEVATGGAAPPSTVIAALERMGFRCTHLYGLTETYGPAAFCAWQEPWNAMTLEGKAAKIARQGVRYPTLNDLRVSDPETLEPVPADGECIGEVLVRGNTVMKGYLKNPEATSAAFADGWFHSGDLAVMHADGYMEIKDRSKDIIISGGENISSLEVEEMLHRHPYIMEAAVVARPDETWGESPCAFVAFKPGAEAVSAADIITWCRDNMAHFKCPRHVVFGPLPKTATGKIQKFTLRERARDL
ncbi:acyl-CoA synthetase [Alphaproteobacteria bacterium]|nr:acyl-CoA synthetase [Alphaproteobacteria bacterium]